jgi:predicted transcriptional regulator
LAFPVKRNRIEILRDILEVLKRQNNIRLIRISYGANLPFDRAKKLIETLTITGLVGIKKNGETITYYITSRGLEFLEVQKKMFGFLEELKEE